MAPNLKVDYQLLDSTERNLSSLVDEFDHIKAQADGYDGAMGSGDVAGAMGTFSGNWDYHRGKLVESMKSLGEMVSETKKHFRKTDDDLKKCLVKK